MWAGRLSTSFVRTTLVVALSFCVPLLMAPAAGAAPPQALTTISRVDTVQVGPLSVAGGFHFYLTGQDCGSIDPDVTLTYLGGSPTDRLSHTYTAVSAGCSIQARPAGARLTVDVPGFVAIAVRLGDVAAALAHAGVPVGCGPPAGPELPAVATGRIDVAIHPAVFGRLAVAGAHADAEIFSGAPQTCPAVQAPDGRELTADVGSSIVEADQPSYGAAQLDILDGLGDDPAPGLAGVLGLHMSGVSALNVDPSTGSAQIASSTSLTAGSLRFTPLAPCPGASAQNGTLSGTLTIEDPVLGPQPIVGSAADSAYTGLGTAQPGTCNGPGARPLEPDLIDTCTTADGGCTLTGAGAATTFFDETSSGTQTITGETLDFGDGSAPVALSPGGAIEHTYGAVGSYMATVTVTDVAGDTATASVDVVIDP